MGNLHENTCRQPVSQEFATREEFHEHWDAVQKSRSVKTRAAYDWFYRGKFCEQYVGYWKFITEGHKDGLVSQKLSSFFMAQFTRVDLYKLYEEDEGKSHPEIMCEWLNAIYEAILLRKFVEPNSARGRITQAILNNKSPSGEIEKNDWKPAYINSAGKVVFLEVSKLEVQEKHFRIEFTIEDKTPFIHDIALKAGFKKILSALHVADQAQTFMNVRSFYLGDKEAPIVGAIENLQKCNKDIFITAEKINAFDFNENVYGFLTDYDSRYKSRC